MVFVYVYIKFIIIIKLQPSAFTFWFSETFSEFTI